MKSTEKTTNQSGKDGNSSINQSNSFGISKDNLRSISQDDMSRENKSVIARSKGENSLMTDTLVFALFIISLIIVSIFHEPWYDEAQAWLIAADASWKELFFSIPHYEGHPPLWHLILALSAKSGLGADLGLRISGFAFSALSAWIIIRKAPFRRLIRYTIPFTYYCFYRYSVVVRPYCMTMAALLLTAVTYKNRNKHPLRYILALLFLSMTNAFGMMLAAGICIVWVIEILREKKKAGALMIDRRVWLLMVTLIYNIAQLMLMIPYENTNSVRMYSPMTILYGLVYLLLIGPADSMFLDVGMDARLQDYAKSIVAGGLPSVFNLIIGLITVLAIWQVVKKYRERLLLIIPYTLFAIFGASVYFWYHHIGLIFLFLVFVFWCCYDKEPAQIQVLPANQESALEQESPANQAVTRHQNSDKKDSKQQLCHNINKAVRLLPILAIGMSLAWNLFACYTDIDTNTWDSKALAEGIKAIGADADDVNCMLMWDYYPNAAFETMDDYRDVTKFGHNVSITNFFDCLIYFDKNIFYNHNEGNENIRYNMQKLNSKEEDEALLAKLAKQGYPEYIIGTDFLVDLLPIEGQSPRYCRVYRVQVYKVDKFILDYNDIFIYAREDVYQARKDWPILDQLRIE